ncbi:MAG TPA: cyclopropane-fatty-acyl-phospholipid synthase family protein [Acidimicrobiales bacterium]|nr:cyclopropane-fatty-acyl-phospholipid synthase family protein [Acidimicrobiales bacterium]
MMASSRVVRSLGRRFHGGRIVVEDRTAGRGAGSARSWSVGEGEPEIHVVVHDARAWSKLLSNGSIGLGESYADGWWDVDDLTDFVRLLLINTTGIRGALDAAGQLTAPVLDRLARLKRPTVADDRRNAQAHYDLPGELFEAMLDDETMAYSCAVFERPGQSLAEAQRAKFDRICAKLRLSPGDHLVEIGTGWGGLAIHAAERYGCRVTTTTTSDSQREVAAKRVADAGLADRVTVLGRDYRDLEGRFDKLVSVEMIEAVDWRLHDTFFRSCARLLRPDGLMALQAITMSDRSYARAKLHDDFIRRMIFPGGCIPSVEAIARSVRRATDLTIIDVEDIGRHYAETLRRWDVAFRAARARLEAGGLDRRFLRMWDLYLCYCEAAFLERHISDVQMVLAKPGWRPTPPFELRSA